MLVMTNMYHLLIFVTFNKLGLDNEWIPFHHTSSTYYRKAVIFHDVIPHVCFFNSTTNKRVFFFGLKWDHFVNMNIQK